MTNPARTGDLRATFSLLAPNAGSLTDADMALLHERVCAVVDEMRAAGVPPERIIIAMKAHATEYGMDWNGKLMSQLVTWCIVHYYGRKSRDPS